MDIYDRMDPELAVVHRQLPAILLYPDNLSANRALMQQMAEAGRLQPDMPVAIENRTIPGVKGHEALMVRLYRPTRIQAPLAALLWIHGGGFMLGAADMEDQRLAELALAGRCLVVSVEYRLAPEHLFPAPLDDCYAALQWLAEQAEALGVDRSRIAIGGVSAGGGLAAGLALLARDRGEVAIAFQLLVYPMLDDRNETPSSRAITMEGVWNRTMNLIGWRAYLGGEPGAADVSPYAAPARAADLRGLPPAFIAVGELDLFLDEDIDYAQRLLQAGVAAELQVYRGAFHGADVIAPGAAVSQRFCRDIDAALSRALAR